MVHVGQAPHLRDTHLPACLDVTVSLGFVAVVVVVLFNFSRYFALPNEF